MATTTTSPSSQEEQFLKAYRRIRANKARPTTLAARDFFHASSPHNFVDTLPQRLQRLVEILHQWNDNTTSLESRRLQLTASILAQAPPSFYSCLQLVLKRSLQARQELWQQDQDDSMQQDDTPPTIVDEENNYNDALLFSSLHSLGWIQQASNFMRIFEKSIHDFISSYITDTIQGEFEQAFFQDIQEWQRAVVEPWVKEVVGAQEFVAQDWNANLDHITATCFCLVRMQQLFDIIADYPDSQLAVEELCAILTKTNLHAQLGETLQASLKRRLIHPGANTMQIIDVYINTIKVLREIDPSDRLLESVTDPVRAYLRGRCDTVRCIITSLTDEEAGGDLYEELRRQDARPLEQAQLDSDDETDPPTMDWQPPPPLSKQRHSFLGKARGGDILSMLVSIYGSKELFVNEYRLMLADKLLANLDYNTDKELHTLELLKLRFGEMSMRQCEVMINDVDNSKRTIHSIHEQIVLSNETKKPIVDATIVSHIFWPALQKEQVKHHPQIQSELDEFSEEYGKLKNPRRLVWMDQLGSVEMELDVVENGEIVTRTFTTSPLLATLISHFCDKETWTAQDLSNETGIPPHVIQKKMLFWIHHHVVKVDKSLSADGEATFQLVTMHDWKAAKIASDKSGNTAAASASMHHHDDDASDSLAVSRGAHEKEEVQVYESFITVMLTNRSLPLDSIHTMLQMMVTSGSDHKYNKTPQQLSAFLQQLCKQDKLECGPDGMFRLVKKDK